jgi:hypothetical protein
MEKKHTRDKKISRVMDSIFPFFNPISPEMDFISRMFSGAKATMMPFFGMRFGKNTHCMFICLHTFFTVLIIITVLCSPASCNMRCRGAS